MRGSGEEVPPRYVVPSMTPGAVGNDAVLAPVFNTAGLLLIHKILNILLSLTN